MKQVLETKDYNKFRSIDGNRSKNLLHVNRLRKAMSENYLFTIIIVNENFEIIDGQHRFDVIKELNLLLNYVICKGYGLKEVHILNQNSETWNADDYLTGYCNLEYKDYVEYAKFKKKYKIGHNETLSLLTGSIGKGDINSFYRGEFKIISLKNAEDIIEKILKIEPFYKNVRRRSFIYAMMGLFKNPNFDFNEFLQKLSFQPTSLMDCTNANNYKDLIEEIYNYRRRVKVNLRY